MREHLRPAPARRLFVDDEECRPDGDKNARLSDGPY